MTPIKKYLAEHKEEFAPWLEKNEQGRIEIKILPHLQEIEKGFFVEAGALDGLFMSNTKILEDLGWTGLLIEPSQKAVAKCKQNRKADVACCALVSKEFEGDKTYGDFFFDGEGGVGAWSGIHRNAYGIRAMAEAWAKTLEETFDAYGIKKVDFLSLDVEGFELEALKGIDFSKVEIGYILIEVNLRDYTLEDVDNFLAQFGYKNLGCLSGFTADLEGWDGSHNDYLYAKS